MNEIDFLITDGAGDCVKLKRFIDDDFAFLMSQKMPGERLLTIANELNDAIKFTLEMPSNNQLPFLDTLDLTIPQLNLSQLHFMSNPFTANASRRGIVMVQLHLSGQFLWVKPEVLLLALRTPLIVKNLLIRSLHCS
jgi:hypothetical protein